MRRFLLSISKGMSVGLMFVLMLGWLQNYHPAFDAFTQFRLHIIAILLVALLVFLAVRSWAWAATAVTFVVVSLGLTAPYLPGLGPPSFIQNAHVNSKRIEIVQFNMRFNNPHTDKTNAVLRSVDPDVYILQELTNRNKAVFSTLKRTHPHQLECISRVVGSVALASKHPIIDPEKSICSRRKGFLAARISVDGTPLTVSSLHTGWPWPYSQHEHIGRLEKEFRRLEPPLILAGDFNAAPWSHTVHRVAEMTKARIVPGVHLTWRPIILGWKDRFSSILPLDQIIHSSDLVPVSSQTLEDGGSDHLPIRTEFLLKDSR